MEKEKDTTNNREGVKIDIDYVVRYQKNKNDFEAFEEIYNFYKHKIYRFSYSFLKDNDKTEEVVQETFIKVINYIQTLRDPKGFNVWIYRINYSLIMIHFRKERRYHLLDDKVDMSDFCDEKENQIQNYQNMEILDNVKESFEVLSDRLKITAELYYFEDMKIKEIAKVLNIPVGTVKSRLTIIRNTLQEELKKKGISPSNYLSLSFAPLMWGLFKNLTSISSLNETVSKQILEGIKETTFVGSVIVSGGITKTAMIAKEVGVFSIIATIVAVIVFSVSQSTLGISKIIYNTEMTRNKVSVTILPTKEVGNGEVSVIKDKQEIKASVISNVVSFDANENGKYVIQIGEDTEMITITSIDRKAPVAKLESATEKQLKLKISDNFSGVDLKKSYVMSNGNRYPIHTGGLANGTFLEEVNVHLYDNVGNYSEYIIGMRGL